MTQPISQHVATAFTGDRGVKEFSIVGDPAGYSGNAGLQYGIEFTGHCYILGFPFADAATKGAVYLSMIHGPQGSDPANPAAVAVANVIGQGDYPAFINPEVTGFYGAGSPSQNSELLNGYLNTEKRKRLPSDAQITVGSFPDATVWIPAEGRRRLAFSLWCQSDDFPAADFFVLEVYRDLNILDKQPGAWDGANTRTNAQLIYKYGPFVSKPAPGLTDKTANAQTSEPIDLPAGCGLYALLRNISHPEALNRVVGSVRLVP
jgi:hypothetical protein